MKKATVDNLLETVIDQDNVVSDANMCIVTKDDQYVINSNENEIEVHKLEDAIQINYPDSTVLIAYDAIKIIEIS